MEFGGETVLQLGDPGLRRVAAPVDDPTDPAIASDMARLHRALAAFRARFGFGRAIAAPQIGIGLRFVALDLSRGVGDRCGAPARPFTIINPVITQRSDETFTLWDDCMSFPDLLVRVRRAAAITVEYTDEEGTAVTWTITDRALAELVQHELDHLDGVLAVDPARAVGPNAIVTRAVFERMPEHFAAQVDGLGDV